MSSDSEDDYSYTNSVSVLKALTRKKDESIDSDVTTGKGKVNFFESPKLETRGARKILDNNTELIQIDEIINDTKSEVLNDSCVILSDGEADLTPVNIISAIDDVLKSKRKPKRGKRKRTLPPRQTRQSKKTKKSKNVHDTSTNSDVYIVEDLVDANEVNYELTIKVYWKSQYVEKFTMRRFDKMTNVFKHFSDKEDVPENRLLFTIKDRVISKSDSPDSLSITAATIIEGGILSAKSDVANKKQSGIEFKVQMNDRKHPLLISVKPEDKMEVLMIQCAQELNISVNKLKFYFDGELIKSSDTPESLDLEGGEIIDCVK